MSTGARRGLIGLALVAALLLILGPVALAGHVERAYRGLLAGLLQALPNGSLVSEHYERGWFRSGASAELLFQPGPEGEPTGAPVRVRLDSRIEQGPGPWFSPRFPPVLARVLTRVELDGLPLAMPASLLTTDIQANGGGVARLEVPAAEGPVQGAGYRVRNGAIEGRASFAANLESLSAEAELPSIELIASTGAPIARLSDGVLSVELERGPGPLYAGSGRLTVASAVLGGAGSDAGAGPDRVTELEGLSVELAQMPAEGLLGIRFDLGADRVQGGGASYRAARLAVNAERLDVEVLTELAEGVGALSSGAVPQAMSGLVGAALMARLLPRLAAAGPSVAIDPLQLETPDGPVSGRLTLGLSGDAGGGIGALALIGALNGNGEIAVPEPVALEMARRWLGGGQTGVPDDRARDTLQGWVREGWVTARDGRISSTFRLAGGSVSVNGKDLPLLRQVFR